MSKRRLGLIAVGAAAVAALTLGGSSLALAATGSPAAATVAPSAGSTTDSSTDQAPPASADTAVTGAEADKVIAAVVAKDANASITTVRKDPDGSYDALGTSGGSPVFYDVSADLATVTAGGGGHGGPGHGGPGGAADPGTGTGTATDSSTSTSGDAAGTNA
jgi:hypothetical protein